MYCQKCGHQNPDSASRCENCGLHFAGAALKTGAIQLAQSGIVKGLLVPSGGTLASLGIIVVLLAAAFEALSSLGALRYSAGSAILKSAGFLIGGFFGAIVIDWMIMAWLEVLALIVGIASNIRKLANGK